MKNIFSNKISANLFSLTSAEIASRLFGFFTLVYLGRTLDTGGFGIIGFATAFVSYFVLVVNFGFSTYGTREIAKDQTQISKYVNNILSIRILLAVILSVALVLFVTFSEKNLFTKYVILISGINIFTFSIALNWVFQAVEKMQYIAFRQIVTGLLSLMGVIVLVHSSDDVIIAAAVLSISALIGNMWFIPIYQKMFAKLKFEFSLPFWRELFKESLPLAFASIMIGIYYNLDTVMLGYMKPKSDVGIYNAAYKIFMLGIVPFNLIFTSFFPTLSRVGLTDSQEFRNTIRNYAKSILGLGIVIGTILLVFSERIILIVFGVSYLAASVPLMILSVNIIVISANVFLGNPMTAWGKQKEYSLAIAVGAAANVILNFILIPKYSYVGAAFATLASEVAVFIGLFSLFKKFTANLFKKNYEI